MSTIATFWKDCFQFIAFTIMWPVRRISIRQMIWILKQLTIFRLMLMSAFDHEIHERQTDHPDLEGQPDSSASGNKGLRPDVGGNLGSDRSINNNRTSSGNTRAQPWPPTWPRPPAGKVADSADPFTDRRQGRCVAEDYLLRHRCCYRYLGQGCNCAVYG